MEPYNPHPHVHEHVHPHAHHHVHAPPVAEAVAIAAPALAPDHNREHIDFLRREADTLEASAKRLRDLANVLENGGEIDTDGTSLRSTTTTRGLDLRSMLFETSFSVYFNVQLLIYCSFLTQQHSTHVSIFNGIYDDL